MINSSKDRDRKVKVKLEKMFKHSSVFPATIVVSVLLATFIGLITVSMGLTVIWTGLIVYVVAG